MNIKHMHGTSFDWLVWTGGYLTDLGIQYNEVDILRNRHIIKRYAIGYCEGDKVICRPKLDRVAIMFLKDDKFFWTHLTTVEFEAIWGIKI